MRILIFIILGLIPFFGKGQENDSTETLKRFAIGVNYSVDRTYRALKNTTDLAVFEGIKSSRDSRELPSLNYSFGLNLNYTLTKNFNLEVGIHYARLGYHTKGSDLLFSDLNDPRRGFNVDVENLPVTEKLIINHNYLMIPLGLRLYVLGSNVRLFLNTGISLNIFMSLNAIYEWELTDGSTEKVVESGGNNNKINLSFIFGGGIDYTVNEKWSVLLNPNYKRSISSIVDEKVNEYLLSMGVNMGVFYKF